MIRRCMLVCLVVCGLGLAQPVHPEWYTGSYTNGRYWLASGLAEKLTYIEAFRDGVNVITSLLGPAVSKSMGQFTFEFYIPPASMTLGDIIEALDKFYAEVENRPIPVCSAFTIISARGRGSMNETELQKWILDDRKKAAADAAKEAGPSVPSNTLSTPTGVKKQ